MDKVIQILKLLPALFAAIKAVEDALPMAGMGNEKLTLIREIMESTHDAVSDLWPSIAAAVGKIVALFNKAGVFNK